MNLKQKWNKQYIVYDLNCLILVSKNKPTSKLDIKLLSATCMQLNFITIINELKLSKLIFQHFWKLSFIVELNPEGDIYLSSIEMSSVENEKVRVN